MTLTFFTNRLNHHQAPVADELYRLLGDNFHFVETERPLEAASKGSTEDFSKRSYLIKAWENEAARKTADEKALSSDVAVFGAASIDYEVMRVRNTDKLTFDLSERWFKRGLLNAFSPHFVKHFWYYHTLFHRKPVYKLCASAFAARDERRMLAFRNRCFKWGYFPRLAFPPVTDAAYSNPIRFMWCSRFVNWKHPELAIKLIKRLCVKGYRVSLDMYGDGPELAVSKELASRLGMNDIIRFYGSQPNEVILDEMRKHDVFLFTSDRMEGWGVVANEAISNGCVLVASDAIGSTPYLLRPRDTGIVYESGNLNSMEKEVEWLLDNPASYKLIRKNGLTYLSAYWSPAKAAEALVRLSCELMENLDNTTIKDGPCSKA